MPTLLQINTTLNSGSTGRIVEQISEQASKDGWDCYIAHGGRYINRSKFNAIKISSRWDNYIHAFLGEVFGMHGLGSIVSTKKFINEIKRIKPDIIHLHNIHGYYLNYKILFEYLAGENIPIVWTLHDCWSFTGHCTHFEFIGCEKWKTECKECPLLMAQYKSRLVDNSKSNYFLKKALYKRLKNVTIVPVSYWLSRLVERSILKDFNVKVIRNGIDLDLFKPRKNEIRDKLGINNNKTIVLGVVASGFSKEKGRGEFIKLSKQDDYTIVLVGLSKKEQKGLPSNIICIDRTNNQEELSMYYSAADVFLNPTYNDTFPTTNLESLACGTPVVTYHTGGSPESIDDSTGIVVEKGDFEGLLTAIKVIRLKGKQSYSQACRERAIELFDKNERLTDYLLLYNRLISVDKER